MTAFQTNDCTNGGNGVLDEVRQEVRREARSAAETMLTFFKWIAIALVTGAVGGGVGSMFHVSVQWAAQLRGLYPWMLWLLPVGGLAIAGMYRLSRMENENTNAIIDSIHFGDDVPLLLVPCIYFGTVITHLFGGSAGREGAALQIGGSLGCYIAGSSASTPRTCASRRCAA